MANRVVIHVEDIGKLYRLGQIGTGTLSHDLKRWWAMARGQDDPYQKIGVENDRTSKNASLYTWALKDINFDIRQGDTLGIIGKNGAGKSTLLKILSRVTSPTKGNIKIKGRIASLLEVGTGFHPEMTGRENIYMNGAILGMTKSEIKSKFDEIVNFAGVELYINTPVKRYSSGMYVRLAFAVAAHLEPEILIVDEVLAVGDADFQKKCLGKMGDVASHGRTIIFVSHNMTAVQNLCKTTLYLKNGMIADFGTTDKVINNYLNREIKNCLVREWEEKDAAGGNQFVRLLSAEIATDNVDPSAAITIVNKIIVSIKFINKLENHEMNLSLFLMSSTGQCIFNVYTPPKVYDVNKTYVSQLEIPGNFLNDNIYSIRLFYVKDTSVVVFSIDDMLTFEVNDVQREGNWYGKWEGVVRPKLPFVIKEC